MENKKEMKSKNNQLAIAGLIVVAILCVGVSIGILCLDPTDAKQLITTTFAPVGLITAGLLGWIKH